MAVSPGCKASLIVSRICFVLRNVVFYLIFRCCVILPQVRVLYDFEGDRPSGELVVYADEILTVSRTVRTLRMSFSYFNIVICFKFFRACFSLQDVGDGWWEGISPDGSRGLFPEAYVEVKFEDHN